jgi:uncharacterized membrane protein
MQKIPVARGVLLSALVIVFGIFGVDKFARPLMWIGWIPLWMEDVLGIARETWLLVAGGIELLLAAALLFPHRLVRRIAAAGMILHLIAVLTQTGFSDIFVRDLGLLFSAIGLLILL